MILITHHTVKAHAEAEVEYKLIHTAKRHHAQHNLKNFRLLVLAFQVNHHHTYPISSRAIQQAYTSTWYRDLIPLQLS